MDFCLRAVAVAQQARCVVVRRDIKRSPVAEAAFRKGYA
jgi:hypothetical protein